MKTIGHFAIRDSGVPAAKTYTTLVLLHGFAWHSAVFSRMLPFAGDNSRIILVNRRDYPGSTPISDSERTLLDSANSANPNAGEDIGAYMKDRAQDLHDFLETLVVQEHIPLGSMVVAGWSFGSTFILALLAHGASLSVKNPSLPLTKYIKRFVTYDPPYHALGYPPPLDSCNPLIHPSLAPGEGVKLFPAWVSGYYLHGDSPSSLEHRVALLDPPPTILTMSLEEILGALYDTPTIPGGSDDVLMQAGIKHGLYTAIRKAALYVPVSSGGSKSDWDNIELRYIWCDRSVWEMPWGTWALQAEIEEAKNSGKPLRNVSLMRLPRANHFAHWDQPERALKALLSDAPEEHPSHL